MRKIALGGLVLLSVLGVCSWSRWSSYRLMMGEPTRDILARVPAPNGTKTAILLRSSKGGATVGFFYRVAISGDVIETDATPSLDASWIWKSYRVEPVSVRWTDSRKVEVLVSSSDEPHFDTIETREWLGVTTATVDTTPSSNQAEQDNLWRDLLRASLEKTDRARRLVEETAQNQPQEPAGKLAQVLLEEWDLPPVAEELRRPRVVHAPKPDFSDSQQWGLPVTPLIVVAGEVTPWGTIRKARLTTTSGASGMDQCFFELFQAWRYRPARGPDGYVNSKVAASCHINLQ